MVLTSIGIDSVSTRSNSSRNTNIEASNYVSASIFTSARNHQKLGPTWEIGATRAKNALAKVVVPGESIEGARICQRSER